MLIKHYIHKYVVLVVLGFYFVNLTPVHMYVHTLFDTYINSHSADSDNLNLDDCNFIQFSNNCQGQFNSPDEFSFNVIVFNDFTFKGIIFTELSFIENDDFYNFSLRAPPFFI